MSEPKILFFDIECTNLNANFGYMLCIGYKWLGKKKTHIIKISDSPRYKKDVTNDSWVAEEFRKIYNKADIVVGWYSDRFDIPYINTRLLEHGLHTLAPVSSVDLWRTSRWQLKLSNNRLDTVAKFFDFPVQKTAVTGKHWVKAMSGHKPSLAYIVDHCVKDIEVLEMAYNKLLPMVKNHPNVRLITGSNFISCPKCDSYEVNKEGYKYASTGVKRQVSCKSCGSWSLIPHSTRRGDIR